MTLILVYAEETVWSVLQFWFKQVSRLFFLALVTVLSRVVLQKDRSWQCQMFYLQERCVYYFVGLWQFSLIQTKPFHRMENVHCNNISGEVSSLDFILKKFIYRLKKTFMLTRSLPPFSWSFLRGKEKVKSKKINRISTRLHYRNGCLLFTIKRT